MGIGVSLAFIAIGAILAFALHVDLSGVNIQAVGWILILVGLVSMAFTLMYTRPRRRRAGQLVEDAPSFGEEPGGVVRDQPAGQRPVVERVIERPVPPAQPARDRPATDPAAAQDPARAQDPGQVNPAVPLRPDERRPHER